MPTTSEVSLESTFSDLAFARLRDKSADLLDYLLGFQMLKSEEDGSRAVGIFGLEVDGAIYYIPMFFLNGEIKGPDSIYSVDSDLFAPISEDWTNQLINRASPSIGKTDTRSRNERGVRTPNYTRLNQIPGGLAKMSGSMLEMRSTEGLPDFASFVKSAGIQGWLAGAMERHPKLAEAVTKYYDFVEFAPDTVATKVAAVKERKLILVNNISQGGVDELTDKQREEVLAGGVAVIDKRPELTKSVLYTTQTINALTSPTTGGLYDVVMLDGSLEPMIVGEINGAQGKRVLISTDGKRTGFVNLQDIFTRRQYSDQAYREALDKVAVALDKVSPNKTYILVSVTGEASQALFVRNVVESVDGNTILKVSGSFGPLSCKEHGGLENRVVGGQSRYLDAPWNYSTDSNRFSEVVVTKQGGHNLRLYRDKIIVGDQFFKAVERSYGEKDSEINAGDLGDQTTVMTCLEKVAAPLKVWTDGPQVVIRDQHGTVTLNKLAALEYLLDTHRLGELDAKHVVKTASASPESYRIKYAAELLGIPDLNDQSAGGGFMTAHTPETVPVNAENRASSPDNSSFYRYNSPFAGGDDEESTVDAVSRAAELGQKEVFDAASLSALIKHHNPTELVERYLPTVTAGMDKLGRLLFLVYWHYAEFEDRYGEDDLAEFIDELRNTFNELGAVVMFMKSRTLAGDKDFFGLGVTGPDTAE